MVDHPHPVDLVDPEFWTWNITGDGDVDITCCGDTDDESLQVFDYLVGGFLSWIGQLSAEKISIESAARGC